MPGPAPVEYSPFISFGMPQANSTTSRPRWMSPRESASVLPCSDESSAARLSNSLCTSSRNLNMTRARRRNRDGVVDLGMPGEGDLGLHLPGIGIEHVAMARGNALDGLAADEVADLAHPRLTLFYAGAFSRQVFAGAPVKT